MKFLSSFLFFLCQFAASGTPEIPSCARENRRCLVLRVMFRAKKMERHVRLIAHDPAVVAWADVKHISRPHIVVTPVLHLARRATGHDHPDMFQFAESGASWRPHMHRPFPSRFITCATDGYRSD